MSLRVERLLMAAELSKENWKLAFGNGSEVRVRDIPAGNQRALLLEVTRAKEKLGLPADAQVVCGYEAGRDGFWVHRMLMTHGFENHVMDPASLEVPRRARNRKTDRLDAEKLLQALVHGVLWNDRKAFSEVRVPTEDAEAARRLHRERSRLVKERSAHRTRLKALGALHGITMGNPIRTPAEALRDWQGKPLSGRWVGEIQREQQRLRMVEEQIRIIEMEQQAALEQPQTPAEQKAQKLMRLKALGPQSGWVLGHECFGGRTFRNRKHLGSFAGLTGTPFDSGQTCTEQGISKAGNRRVRITMIEVAWLWVRWQPGSTLTHWFLDHYVKAGSSRSKRKGIVALARKLLVALWKYVEFDTLPEGAVMRA